MTDQRGARMASDDKWCVLVAGMFFLTIIVAIACYTAVRIWG